MPKKGPDHTRPLIAAVGISGLAALVAIIVAFPPALGPGMLRRALALVVLTAASELAAIRLRHGTSSENLTLFDLAVVADIVLLPPSIAALVSVAGLAIALAIHRKSPAKFAFNLGQYALAVVPAIAIYRSFGHGNFDSSEGLLALFGGMVLFTAINFIAITAIIAAATRSSWWRVLREEGSISLAMGVGNSAVGMVAVALYLERPVLLPAVLAPTLALHVAFRGWVKQKDLTWKMEEESTKLGRILESSTEGIVLADARGRVEVWSPSMERMTGVAADEAKGKALSYLLRGHDVYGRAVAIDVSEKAEPTDVGILSVEGDVLWLRVQHGPGFDTAGALSFDVLLVTDITRQREVDRLKEDFFSTVSHELRTPLTPIKGYAALLLRRGDDIPAGRRQEALQSIVERTEHMSRLVEDLLLASRIANGAERRMPEVSRQPVDVSAVVERALRSFRVAHPHREFVVQTEGDVFAAGDPIRVEQIVANLVSNAVKFSPEGSVVDIEVEGDKTEVRIHVSDQGRGVPREKREEIFERFKRLEDPMKMETSGAGLGLFIVRELARAMGGSVRVHSDTGRGSTFVVALPNMSAPAAHAPRRRADDDRRAGDGGPVEGGRRAGDGPAVPQIQAG